MCAKNVRPFPADTKREPSRPKPFLLWSYKAKSQLPIASMEEQQPHLSWNATKRPYKGFLDVQEASEMMGGKYPDFQLVSNKVYGYKVERSGNFLYSRFRLQMDKSLERSIDTLHRYNPKANQLGCSHRVELVFLLFHVCLHVLAQALPKDASIKHQELYSRLPRMLESITCDADLRALLVQFLFAFPTDQSIQEHKDTISSVWTDNHHPSVFLEMTALIGCLKLTSTMTSEPIEQRETRIAACRSVLLKLDSFHRRSGTHLTVSFMKVHLNRQSRREHNPDAPDFWYQSLLGRIAQVWLCHDSHGTITRKRKPSEGTVTCNENTCFRHWDGYTTHKLMNGVDDLPMGIPSCLLTRRHHPTTAKSKINCPSLHCHQKENIPPNGVQTNRK